MRIRRIVTAERPDGHSSVAVQEEVRAVSGHLDWFPVWGWDTLPALPIHQPLGGTASVFPPPGGVRVAVSVMPGTSERPRPAPSPELRGLIDAVSPGGRSGWADGMHDTETIDIVFVITGSVVLTLSDSQQSTLEAGDVLVQNGTAHSWHNPFVDDCVLGMVIHRASR